jgi:hypothetical protein
VTAITRQVRVPLAPSIAASSPPTLAEHAAIVVDLSPSSLLYVPPFWTHAVESLSPSLSLSVLSPSWEEAVGARLAWPPLPYGNLPPGDRPRLVAVSLTVRVLLPELLPLLATGAEELPTDVAAFAAALYEARHAPPLPHKTTHNSHNHGSGGDADGDGGAAGNGETPSGGSGAAGVALASSGEDDTWAREFAFGCAALRVPWSAVEEQLGSGLPNRTALLGVAREVVAHATRTEADGRRLPVAVLRLLVRDHLEALAAWAVGEERVGALLLAWARCTWGGASD